MGYSELVLQHARMIAEWPLEEWLEQALAGIDHERPESYVKVKLVHAMLEVRRILEREAEKRLEDQG